MALIGKIRNNSWLLILTLGVALAAFIIMDMTSAGDMGGGGQTMTIGNIAGEDVDWRDFQTAEDILYSGSGADLYERRDFLWDFFVERTLMDDLSKKMGLGVSETEMDELQYGNNLSPLVRQRFMNPNTGQVDRNQLAEIRQGFNTNTLDPGLARFWRFQQSEIKTDRLQSKLANLTRKSMFTPSWMAEDIERTKGTTASFDYVNIPFSAIADDQISISDSEIRNYIRDNRRQFERKEESRRVAYVTFEVFPTSEDSSEMRRELGILRDEFIRTEDDSLFTDMNFGYFDAAYYREDQLSPAMAEKLFTMEIGEVSESFVNEGNYTLVKLVDRKVVPDSVRSRHILRAVNDPAGLLRERRLLDSLANLIETGVKTFDSLAVEFGMDATSLEGGDLGFTTPGMMVKPFNDLIFYKAEPGQLYTVTTQFGVHLVEVTERVYTSGEKGVRFAAIEQPIMPSEDTQNAIYDEVLNFIADNRSLQDLEASASQNPRLNLTTSNWLTRNSYSIQGLGANTSSRDMVRWAFTRNTRVNNVSPEIYSFQHPNLYYTEKYVVAALREIQDEGLPTVDAVRSEVEPILRNKKKAEKLIVDLSGLTLQQAADQFGQTIRQANDINLNNNFITGIGNEPAVVGALKALASGQQSNPIAGNSGVFILRVTNKVEPPVVNITAQVRRQLSADKQNEVNALLMESIREHANIEDARYRLY
jgi:peptidyl-prolyl cis-trans isomerase D